MESEVTKTAMKEVQIEPVITKINLLQASFNQDANPETMQELMELYNKAIEYYSAFDNDKHLEYLEKLQMLFRGEQLQQVVAKEEEKKEVEVVSKDENAKTE